MVICIYALRNIVAKKLNEFRRKLELGRELKIIITEDKIMKASLVAEHAEVNPSWLRKFSLKYKINMFIYLDLLISYGKVQFRK